MLKTDQRSRDTQLTTVGLAPSPTMPQPIPTGDALVGEPQLAGDHATIEAQPAHVSGTTLAPDHARADAQSSRVGGNHLAGDQVTRETQVTSVSGNTLPIDQAETDTQSTRVNGDVSVTSQACSDAHGTSARDADAYLLISVDFLDDVERLRISTQNRIRSIEQVKQAAVDSPEHARWLGHLATVEQLEKDATKEVERAVKQHPLGDWVKQSIGVGLKQGGRLLAALGDPSWNDLEDRPRRGPAELWAYCGYAPDQKRRKGVKSNWNATAKMRAYLIAEKCLMFDGAPDKNGNPRPRSPYRDVYDKAKASWADRDTSDGHKHNHALRVASKAILRDLWVEATELRRTNLNATPKPEPFGEDS